MSIVLLVWTSALRILFPLRMQLNYSYLTSSHCWTAKILMTFSFLAVPLARGESSLNKQRKGLSDSRSQLAWCIPRLADLLEGHFQAAGKPTCVWKGLENVFHCTNAGFLAPSLPAATGSSLRCFSTSARQFRHRTDLLVGLNDSCKQRFEEDDRKFPPGAYQEDRLLWRSDEARVRSSFEQLSRYPLHSQMHYFSKASCV